MTVGKHDLKRRRIDPSCAVKTGQEHHDSTYFKSYGDLSIHQLMLEDRPRMQKYVEAIEQNKEYLKDKVVMDVGTGTGFLAMMCVLRGGTHHVHAIEACHSIGQVAKDLIEKNGLSDKITVHIKRVEELTEEDLNIGGGDKPSQTSNTSPEKSTSSSSSLGEKSDEGRTPSSSTSHKRVDAIISEWMGFYLVHESMLDSVLHARDKFLKPNGLMLPSHARIFAAPIDMRRFHSDKLHYFADENFFGLKGFGDYFDSLVYDKNSSTGRKMIANRVLLRGEMGTSTSHKMSNITQQEIAQGRADFFFSGAPDVEMGITPDQPLADPQVIVELDLKTIPPDQLAEFEKILLRFTLTKGGLFGGVGLWFDCRFEVRESTSSASSVKPVILSTAPEDHPTHWKQAIIFLVGEEGPVFAEVPKGEVIDFSLQLTQSAANKRHYEICLET